MNRQNKEKLTGAVSALKMMGFEEKDIMVTGSLALDIQGVLPENRTAHDADFIIRMDRDTWGCLKLLAALQGRNPEYTGNDNISVNCGGMTVNIWRSANTYEYVGMKDSRTGVWVSPVNEILDAKKRYGRAKDIRDINEICAKILK